MYIMTEYCRCVWNVKCRKRVSDYYARDYKCKKHICGCQCSIITFQQHIWSYL